MEWLKAIILGLVCLGGIWLILYIYKLNHKLKNLVVEDEAEKVAMFRSNIADETIAAYCGATMTPRNTIDPQGYALNWSTTMIEIVEESTIIKFYFYWEKQRIVIVLLDDEGKVHKLNTRIKENRIDLAKMMKFFAPYQKEMPVIDEAAKVATMLELIDTERERLVDGDEKAFQVLLEYVWPNLRKQMNWRDVDQARVMFALTSSIMKAAKEQGVRLSIDDFLHAGEDDSSDDEEVKEGE